MNLTKTVASLRPLLDEQGLEGTWKSLLRTHALKLHQNNETISNLWEHEDFSAFPLLEEDLLEGMTVGEASILYEFSLSYVDRDSRKASGQYFTPDDVATFLASKMKTFPSGKWLDPCSGVGNLSYALALQSTDPEEFVLNYLVLQDRDALALFIARALFTLRFNKTVPDFYNRIAGNFLVKDFLTDEPAEHDFVIVNPPYLACREDTRFEVAASRDLYAYFLEKIIKTSKGFISITPQSHLNSSKFVSLRALLLREVKTLDIYAFDNMPDTIFKGYKFGSANTNTSNSVRACIMVANNSEPAQYRITGLLRWTAGERHRMFDELDEQLTVFQPDPGGIFPKIGQGLEPLYSRFKSHPKFKSLLSSKKTEHVLYVPTTPRYYLSATKRTLDRSSFKTLYFKDETDLNTAYLVLNSSLSYWWWRVVDGGMTLSSTTINTIPLPEVEVVPELVEQLEASEVTNLVFKMNAGKRNENVKHDTELVDRINRHLVGDEDAAWLLKVHSNSFLRN